MHLQGKKGSGVLVPSRMPGPAATPTHWDWNTVDETPAIPDQSSIQHDRTHNDPGTPHPSHGLHSRRPLFSTAFAAPLLSIQLLGVI